MRISFVCGVLGVKFENVLTVTEGEGVVAFESLTLVIADPTPVVAFYRNRLIIADSGAQRHTVC